MNKAFGYEPPVPVEQVETLFAPSPYLNLYNYCEELDYEGESGYHVPDSFIRVDALMRTEVADPPFVFPETLKILPGEKLVYVSMGEKGSLQGTSFMNIFPLLFFQGTLGSIDVELMRRITTALGKTPHKFIVSKGQRQDEYDLPAGNCYGEAFLPQTTILPLVDAVVGHGGNNTVTEAMACGKPMLLLPLMGDQFDSAQRVEEKGFGLRLSAYEFTEAQLIEALDRILNDQKMAERLKVVKGRIASSRSKEVACERVEELVEQFRTGQN